MTETWIEKCVNCGKSTMVDRVSDKCLFCGKSAKKKEVIMDERGPVPEKPRANSEMPAYWEGNKEAIIADYYAMTLRKFLARWKFSPTTWIDLKRLWEIKGKRFGKLTTAQAQKRMNYTEHEEYLVLLGYQKAVREILAAIKEGKNLTLSSQG